MFKYSQRSRSIRVALLPGCLAVGLSLCFLNPTLQAAGGGAGGGGTGGGSGAGAGGGGSSGGSHGGSGGGSAGHGGAAAGGHGAAAASTGASSGAAGAAGTGTGTTGLGNHSHGYGYGVNGGYSSSVPTTHTGYGDPDGIHARSRYSARGGPEAGSAVVGYVNAGRLQQELQRRGYLPGRLNGRLDGRTADALRRYQQDHGLQPSGDLTTSTAEALGLPVR